MDMKKKLEDAYIPDKQSRKEKVVIGLSGGLDSYVTAYLLKIQKYELLAVTIVNSWEELNIDQNNILSCHISTTKLDEMKEFCHKLGIPLHIHKAGSEFKENVIEGWMADKVLGRRPKPCWNCHALRMSILHGKMKEFGAKHLATGHYAKLFRNEGHGSVFVHTSNDEAHDQSTLLSRLSHDILSSLLLPLSDLTKKEVLKLAENFGVVEEQKKLEMFQCFTQKNELIPVIEKKVPARFLKEGDITNTDNTLIYGQHDGVHRYTTGELTEIRDGGRVSKKVVTNYIYSEKRMIVEEESTLIKHRFLLKNCVFSEEVSWLEPAKGCISVSPDEMHDCWIYPKTLSSVFIVLFEPHKFIAGDMASVFKKKGKNSKVFFSGEINYVPDDPVQEEGEPIVQTFNSTSDF